MTDNQSNSYQDILDKYAESISSKDNPQIPQEKIIPEPELEPMTPPEPILTPEEETLLKSEPSVEPETVLNPPQIEAPPVTEAITSPDVPETIISPPPQIELPLEPSEPMPKKENHFFKYLFFLSLIIFIIVLVLVIISFINSQKPISNSRDIPNNNISPTSLPVTFCEINDQKHAVGTTFPANDSCNTCTCGEDLTINCTTKTCDATPSVKLSPTKSATSSAINKDLKTYSSSLYGFSFQYPSNWIISEKNSGAKSQMSTNNFIQMVEASNSSNKISIYYEGDWDHGFEPWTVSSTDNIFIDNKPTKKTIFKNSGNSSSWILYTIDNFHDFRIEAQVDGEKEISQILSTFKFL